MKYSFEATLSGPSKQVLSIVESPSLESSNVACMLHIQNPFYKIPNYVATVAVKDNFSSSHASECFCFDSYCSLRLLTFIFLDDLRHRTKTASKAATDTVATRTIVRIIGKLRPSLDVPSLLSARE